MARPYRAADSQFVFQHRESRAEFFEQRSAIRAPSPADFLRGLELARGEKVKGLPAVAADYRADFVSAPQEFTGRIKLILMTLGGRVCYISQATRVLLALSCGHR
jgi:hypothetical protein